MLTGGGSWFRRVREAVTRFFNPGPASLLFIMFFIILFVITAPIALRIGKLFVRPILWVYKSRNYSVDLSLTGSVIPAIMAIILAGLLRRRGRRIVPPIMANERFWVFITIYVVFFGTALPIVSPIAITVLLSLNAPMILATPLIFIAAFDLAHEVDGSDYLVAAEAYITLFILLILSDLTTALMTGVAIEVVHLLIKTSLVIGGYGITDGLVLIPTEIATATLITTAITKKPRST
jgi:hypothetical protein